MPSLLVAAPDADEAKALLHGFTRKGVASHEIEVGKMKCMSLPVLGMLLSVGGNGKTQFGVQTQYLIDRCPEAKLLACVGAAGRLSDSVQIGDVVVAKATVEHDYKRRMSPKPLPRHDADASYLREFVHAAGVNQFPFRVHFGVIASGDEDIVDVTRAAEVQAATGALCVAWEGSGGARAARMSGVGFLEVRGITDAADAQAARLFHENLSTAMLNVVELLLAWHAGSRAAA